MAGLLYLAGEGFNLLGRGTVTVTNEDALFPKAGLSDDWCAAPFLFETNGPGLEWKVDLSLVSGGAFTSWTGSVPNGWTVVTSGTGSVAQESPGRGGAGSAARINEGAGIGVAYFEQDIVVRAGESLRFEAWVTLPGSNSLVLQIYNKHTRKWLGPGATWEPTSQSLTLSGTASYVLNSRDFVVEPYGGSNPAMPALTVTIRSLSPGASDIDDVAIYPAVNFASVHGHNFDSVTPLLQSSDDDFGSAATTETMVIAQPSFYSYLPALIYARYWRIYLDGTNQTMPYVGEAVLGQAVQAAQGQSFPWETVDRIPQVRSTAMGGGTRVYSLAGQETRTLRLNFGAIDAAYAELRNEWYRRSQGGQQPMVLVPYDAEPAVIHGKVPNELTSRRLFLNWHGLDFVLEEQAFPNVPDNVIGA